MSDLRQRVPGHSLIDELLHQWDEGNIHLGEHPNEVIIDPEAVSWYRGVIGERRIAELLSQLGPEWTVLHSVPVGTGTGDIDHIVIGPSGVFTINTKYSPGKDVWVAATNLMVDGQRARYVHNAVREAVRAQGSLARRTGLSLPVRGIIVFVEPAKITIREAPGTQDRPISVVSDHQLLATLRGAEILMPHEVDGIVNAAIRPETWHQHPAQSTIGGHIEQEFRALEDAVGPRLAAPVRAARRAPVSSASPRASRSTSRPVSSRPASRGRGRRKASTLEKLISTLAGPLMGFGILWAFLTYWTSR